ncbi:MAG: hypothetical protein JWP95_1921 [Actinotalea sp.]|nr:hypothetical protein [Actinotalea sp.]
MELSPQSEAAAVVPGAVAHREVTFAEVIGFRPLLLDLYVPAGVDGPAPCVVWVHGGGWDRGDRRFATEHWPHGFLFASLVEAGLAVATVDYRLSGEAVHPAQLEDVLEAVRFLRRRAAELGLDPDRLGISGDSAGGHLAAMVALTGTGDAGVQAAAVLYGVTDLAGFDTSGLTPQERAATMEARLLGADPREEPGLAAAASPVHHASAAAPPMLLISGDSDTVVPASHSQELADRLRAAGAEDVVLRLVPGADHCFEGVDPVPPLGEVVAFLADRLRAAR